MGRKQALLVCVLTLAIQSVPALGFAGERDAIGNAAKAAQRMRVLLDVEASEEPALVCLLAPDILDAQGSTGSEPKSKTSDAKAPAPGDGLVPLTEGDRRRNVFSLEQAVSVLARRSPADSKDPYQSPSFRALEGRGGFITREWRVQERNGAGVEPTTKPLNLICEANALTRGDSGRRVLLLRLYASDANPAKVRALSVVGNLVTLHVTDAAVGDVQKALALAPAQGDYDAGAPRFLSGEHEVAVPIAARVRNYRVVHDIDPNLLIGLAPFATGNEQPLAVPIASSMRLEVADVERKGVHLSRTARGPFEREFVLRPTSERTLAVELASFDMTWKRHCALPGDQCPVAHVRGSPGSCGSAPGQEILTNGVWTECRYHCAPPTPLQRFPIAIDFDTAEPFAQSWSIELETLGRPLEGFVPPPDRKLIVDLKNVCQKADSYVEKDPSTYLLCAHAEGQAIERTSITLPGAREVEVLPGAERHVLVAPGLQCDDQINYQHFGEQPWSPSSLRAVQGRIQLPDSTHDLKKLVSFSAQVGGGFVKRWRTGGSVEHEAPLAPIGKVEGILTWRILRKYHHSTDLELRFGAGLSRLWHEYLQPDTDDPIVGIRAVPGGVTVVTVQPQLGFVSSLGQSFYWGASGGAVWTSARRYVQEQIAPMRASAVVVGRGGLAISAALRFELELAGIFPEQSRTFQFSASGDAVPRALTFFTLPIMVSARIDDPF